MQKDTSFHLKSATIFNIMICRSQRRDFSNAKMQIFISREREFRVLEKLQKINNMYIYILLTFHVSRQTMKVNKIHEVLDLFVSQCFQSVEKHQSIFRESIICIYLHIIDFIGFP